MVNIGKNLEHEANFGKLAHFIELYRQVVSLTTTVINSWYIFIHAP